MKSKWIFAALVLGAVLAGCKKDDPETPAEEPKSTECRLTAFVVTTGESTIDGFIDQAAKTVELSYLPNQHEGLSAATAVATISDKATISPDPSVATDYTVSGGVKFTITAEDGVTANVYTVTIAAAEYKQTVNKIWEKTTGELGVADPPRIDGYITPECGVAFVDKEHFATADLNVFDLDGNKVGTLNIDGIGDLGYYNGQLGAMSNDDNGVLFAVAGRGATDDSGAYLKDDGGAVVLKECCIYVWKDGYDKAPTLVYGPTDGYGIFNLSVSGDASGDLVIAFRATAGNPQMFHVLTFTGGNYWKADGESAASWTGPFVQHPGNDGSWQQMISFYSGNPEEGFVCWDSIAASEFGESGNSSSAFYAYNEGLTAHVNGSSTETVLKGLANWTTWDVDGRWYYYGNYSTGYVRAFKYNGEKYIIACSASWPCTWITIQKTENLVEDDSDTEDVDESLSNYLLQTDQVAGADAAYPCAAYVYDPATGTGHVIYLAMAKVALRYDLVTETI